MIEWDRTVISQYANSAVLTQVIENLNTYVDPRTDLEAFYNLIWNVDTAEGYGLDVWGRIVGIERILRVLTSKFLGFQEAGDISADPFDQSPWFADEFFWQPFSLTDEQYRLLIFAKAAANITDSSIPAINQILMNLFPERGNAYVTDQHDAVYDEYFTFQEQGDRAHGWDQAPWGDFADGRPANMAITYVFEFLLEDFEIAMVTSGVLPKPTGVRADYIILPRVTNEIRVLQDGLTQRVLEDGVTLRVTE